MDLVPAFHKPIGLAERGLEPCMMPTRGVAAESLLIPKMKGLGPDIQRGESCDLVTAGPPHGCAMRSTCQGPRARVERKPVTPPLTSDASLKGLEVR